MTAPAAGRRPDRLVDRVGEAVHTLEAAGLAPADARVDAGVLARWVLGWDAATWLARCREAPPAGFALRFDRALARRARREPVSHIVGAREFYGRSFAVTPDVLTPRPETELLAAEALRLLGGGPERDAGAGPGAPFCIDVGTGSGCLAVTIAAEARDARVLATDCSTPALDVARRNAEAHGVIDRIAFAPADLFPEPCPAADLVVSNPPYVPERDRAGLAPEVARCEPADALFAGEDGLDVIRRLVPAAAAVLAPGGHLVMEIGFGQADEVRGLVRTAGLEVIDVLPDLQGIPRVVVARRPA